MYKLSDLKDCRIVRAEYNSDGHIRIELNTGVIITVDDGIGGAVTAYAEVNGTTRTLE